MDPCSTIFGCFFLLGLALGVKAIASKITKWSSTPGAFGRELADSAPEMLFSFGMILSIVGGRFLPDLIGYVFYQPDSISNERQVTWGIAGILLPLLITIPLGCWLSSRRERRQKRDDS